MDQDKNTTTELANVETNETLDVSVTEPMNAVASEPQIESVEELTDTESAEKKEGIWSRIVRSKDSTKLVASLAFCAVFALGTLITVSAFDGTDHVRAGASEMRMEQCADSGMGAFDREDFGHHMNEGDMKGGTDMRGNDRNGDLSDSQDGSGLQDVQSGDQGLAKPDKKATDVAA